MLYEKGQGRQRKLYRKNSESPLNVMILRGSKGSGSPEKIIPKELRVTPQLYNINAVIQVLITSKSKSCKLLPKIRIEWLKQKVEEKGQGRQRKFYQRTQSHPPMLYCCTQLFLTSKSKPCKLIFSFLMIWLQCKRRLCQLRLSAIVVALLRPMPSSVRPHQ